MQRRGTSKPIADAEEPLQIVPEIPKSWRGRTQEEVPPSGLVEVVDDRPPLPHWTSILKGLADARESREGTIVRFSNQTLEFAPDAGSSDLGLNGGIRGAPECL